MKSKRWEGFSAAFIFVLIAFEQRVKMLQMEATLNSEIVSGNAAYVPRFFSLFLFHVGVNWPLERKKTGKKNAFQLFVTVKIRYKRQGSAEQHLGLARGHFMFSFPPRPSP